MRKKKKGGFSNDRDDHLYTRHKLKPLRLEREDYSRPIS